MKEKNKNELVKILTELVTLRSDVDENNNEKLVSDYILDFYSDLEEWSVEIQEITKKRRNIVVSNCDDPELVFIGHQDTVPVTSAKQLRPKIKNNKLYGRGAVDMKCGLALMLLLACEISMRKLKRKIGFVFTVDEEYAFLGIQEFVKQNNWDPQFVINPESTNLRILNQCRGCMEATIIFKGKSAHAGRKLEGVNAIEKALEFCNMFEDELQKFNTAQMKNSLNVAAIEGGILVDGKCIVRPNVVPDFCKLTVEFRIANPSLTKENLEKIALSVARSIGIKIQEYVSGNWYGSLLPNKDPERFCDAIRSAGLAVQYVNPNSAGYYEIQMLQTKWSCPIIAFGPGPNEQSHQSDEYVDLGMLEKSYEVLENFILSWGGR